MRKYSIGVLGATGAVGREMLRQLEQSDIAISRLLPLASGRQEHRSIWFRGDCIPVQAAGENVFAGLDFVLGAVSGEVSKMYCPAILKAGAIYIDNSSAFRLQSGVPLVVPEINGEEVRGQQLIANPNCSTIITLMAVAAIHQLSPIVRLWACTYQAVSGAGQGGLSELHRQLRQWEKEEAPGVQVFCAPILGNVIPCIGETMENGYTSEEMKLQNEGRKILNTPALRASCTCVRVPVERCHCIAVTVQTKEKISAEAARAAIAQFPGCVLTEDVPENLPMPCNVSRDKRVWVGRVREDLAMGNALTLWCCGDQLIKGAAGNAVGILERCIEE